MIETGLILPKRVHKKHGAYYYVHKNKWTRLGKSLEEVESNLAHMQLYSRDIVDMEKFIVSLYRSCKNNAMGGKYRRSKHFDLTVNFVLSMARASKLQCAVTGHPFMLWIEPASGLRPFAPSIDRIDSAQGYTQENVRLVCVATNYAMNRWGEQVFAKLARSYTKTLDSL